MKLLVTGAAGLVGSHLVEHLVAQGDDVVGLDDLSTGDLANLAAVRGSPRVEVVRGSVCDEALLDALTARCDAVFHLAAAVGVRMIVERPIHTLRTNITGTERVLDAASRHRRPVLLASSSEVYGKGASVPFREDDDTVLGPTTRTRWGYACSKAIDEFMAFAYAQERGLPVVVARLFNTVGPRQIGRYGMVIPRLVAQCLDGGPLTVHGDGMQTRCFAWAGDVAATLDALLRRDEARGRVFNVGSDEEVTVRALAERIRARLAPGAAIAHVPYADAYGAGFEDLRRRVPDLARVRALLGPRPTLDLDAILDRVAAHARAGRAA